MALAAKPDSFHAEMKENGRPPPFHIASLLSTSPPPPATGGGKRGNSASATVHHKPPVAGSGGNDEDGLGGSTDLSLACVSAGSCTFQQPLVSLSPSLTLQSPHPCYYPPSTFHVHYQYQLPSSSEFGSFPMPPAGGQENKTSPQPPHSRNRTTYSSEQLQTLESVFSEKKYVNFQDRLRIAREVGVTEKQIKMWFQNRRTKMKKEASRERHNRKNKAQRNDGNRVEVGELE